MKIKNNSGSTIVMALLSIAILSLVSETILYNIKARYYASIQSTYWNEAQQAAESGAELAMIQMNGTGNFSSWTLSGTTSSGTTYRLAQTLPFTSTATDKTYVTVTADNTLSDGSGNHWWRITSKGTVQLPGVGHTAGFENSMLSSTGVKNHRSLLRKLAVTTDSTGGALSLPQMSRTIQVLAQPVATTLFARSLTVSNWMTFSGGAYTDSFNSSNSAGSTNGQYVASKAGAHGDVAVNTSGTASNLGGSVIKGNAMSDGGTIKNTSGVTGSVLNNFSTTLPPVSDPTWTSGVTATPTVVNGSATLSAAGTQANPTRYILSSLTVSGGNVLTISNPTPGTDVYVQVWVQGKMTTSGSGYILQQAGVHVTFYVDSDITVSGSGFDNVNNIASYLMIYGTTPASGSPKFTVSGSGNFIGVVYAPAWALTISGGASYMGAGVFANATVSGGGGFHYDQALQNTGGGSTSGYQFASWIENIE